MAEERSTDVKIEKLRGDNYPSWKRQMKYVLMEKGLWNFVTGTEPRPAEGAQEGIRRRYQTNSDRTFAMIALYVEKSLQIHIGDTTDPREAWDILARQFEFVSTSQVVRLSRKFFSATMREEDDMMEHITLMTTLAQQLRDLGEVITPRKFATTILGSLPESYETFVLTLNARGVNELDWESIKGSLQEEYSKRKERNASRHRNGNEALIVRGSDHQHRNNRHPRPHQQQFRFDSAAQPMNEAMYVRGGSVQRNNQQQQRQRFGNYRNSNGGFSRNNNQNGGYENGRFPSRQNNANMQINANKDCYRCGEIGHIARECLNNNRGSQSNQEQGNFVDSFQGLSLEDEYAFITGDINNADCKRDDWFIDSAATVHMSYERESFDDYKAYEDPKCVALGDNAVIFAEGEGTVRLPVYVGSEIIQITLRNVLYVPHLKKNLFSVPAATASGAEVHFDNEKCIVLKNGKFLELGHKMHGKRLYRINTSFEYAAVAEATSQDLWHYRLGHLNMSYIDQLVKKELATGIEHKNNTHVDKCEPCMLGKMSRLPLPKKSITKSKERLELLHTDLCGPIHVESLGGRQYFLTITDDFSRYKTVYFLKRKEEALGIFQDYVNKMENFTESKVKSARSDNGGEYISNEFLDYCAQKGIHHEFSNPYTPEQNGVSERLNRTLLESARSMLFHANLPLTFWADAVKCAAYLCNRSPTAAIPDKTPFECWYGSKPDLTHLRVFGCIAYVHVPNELRKKLQPKSQKCIFMGYPDDTKGFRLYNLESKKFIRSRSVIFCEDKFHDFNAPVDAKSYMNFFPDRYNSEISADNLVEVLPEIENPHPPHPPAHPPAEPEPELETEHDAEDIPENHATYEERFLNEVQNIGEVRTRRQTNRFESANLAGLIDEHCFLTSLISEEDEPKSVKEAIANPNWLKAMKSEISSMHDNNTWELVPRPSGKNIVGSRWIFKIKRNADGSISRYKARLVAQGYSQELGIDYNEVFSPVARSATIRTLLAVANIHDLEIHQMDVTTAFLNGDLDYEIYMEQPQGFIDPSKPTHVCKLKKSIYGLKQAARCWNNTLTQYLISEGYKKSNADECVYTKVIGKSFVILSLYVDDVIPISNNLRILEEEKRKLKNQFEMVDNGNIHYVLGMQIVRDRTNKTLTISHPNYLSNVLKKFNMENCRPVATPLEAGKKFQKASDNDQLFHDISLYQQAIGSLTYAATTTRPDIAAAVSALSQYMSKPSMDHWTGVKRVLRYIRGTILYHGLSTLGAKKDPCEPAYQSYTRFHSFSATIEPYARI